MASLLMRVAENLTYSGPFVLRGRLMKVIDVMHILISHLNFIPLGIVSKLLRDGNAFLVW